MRALRYSGNRRKLIDRNLHLGPLVSEPLLVNRIKRHGALERATSEPQLWRVCCHDGIDLTGIKAASLDISWHICL